MTTIARTPEKLWLETVREGARRLGWIEYHTHNSRRSTPGFPDLVLVRPPRIIVAELKSETGRVRASQQTWLDRFAACPQVETYVWYPEHWFEVEDILR